MSDFARRRTRDGRSGDQKPCVCRAERTERSEADVAVQLHPDLERLAAYHDGRLPGGEADEVASHLTGCPRCREAMGSLPDEDPLVVLLRSLPREMRPAARREGVPACLADHPRYEVLGEVGRGGMGYVYRARHRLLDRVVAVKQIRNPASRAATERFLREARAAARLDHPNVVRVHEAEEHAGQLLLVMEHVEGADLARLVRERGPLPVAEACGYIRQAAMGLQHAHEAGLVHRDMKPSNLIVAARGVVKVVDFGLASLVGEDTQDAAAPGDDTPATGSLTAIRGRGMGTPDYVAPEQAADASAADIRADIYSLGCTLYHLLAGRPPFDEGDAGRRVLGHLLFKPTPVREVRPGVPAALARVIERMTAKDPAARFQTPAEAAEALGPFASPRRGGRRLFLALAGLAVAGGAAGLAWLLARPMSARVVRRFEAGHAVQSLAFAGGGSLLLSGGDDGVVRVWDVEGGEMARDWEAHRGWVLDLAVLPGGRLATASNDRTLKVWEVATGREVGRMAGHDGAVACVSASPDGRRLLSGGDDQTARLWDARGGRQLLVLEGHRGPVQRAAFSPDGKLAVTGGNDRTVRVWDLSTGREARRLEGHNHVVTDATVSPDGRVFSGSYDRTTRLWDGEEEVARHDLPLRVARVFAAGGHLLAFGVDDAGGCRLYEAAGVEVCRFPLHQAAVWCVAVTPDGRRAATGDKAGRIVVWDVPRAR